MGIGQHNLNQGMRKKKARKGQQTTTRKERKKEGCHADKLSWTKTKEEKEKVVVGKESKAKAKERVSEGSELVNASYANKKNKIKKTPWWRMGNKAKKKIAHSLTHSRTSHAPGFAFAFMMVCVFV